MTNNTEENKLLQKARIIVCLSHLDLDDLKEVEESIEIRREALLQRKEQE